MFNKLLRRKTDGEGGEGKHYKKANMGGANKMYYNEELKMWVEKGKEEEARAEKAKHSAPPPSVSSISAASSTTSLPGLAADAPDTRPPSFTRGRSLADRYRATPALGPVSGGSSGPPSGKSFVPGLPRMPGMPSPAGSTAALPAFPSFMPTPTASDAASDMAVGSSTAGSISLSQSNLSMADFSIANSRAGSQPQLFTPSDPEAAAAAGGVSEAESASCANGHALAPGQEPAAEGAAELSSNGNAAVSGQSLNLVRSETLESSLGGASSAGLPAMSGTLSFANWQPLSPQALAAQQQQHEHKQRQHRSKLQRHDEAAPPFAGHGEEPEVTSHNNKVDRLHQPSTWEQHQQPHSGAHHQPGHLNDGYQLPEQPPLPAADSNGNGIRQGYPDDQDTDNNWGPPGYAADGAPVSALHGLQVSSHTYSQDGMWAQAAVDPPALPGAAAAVDAEGGAAAGWTDLDGQGNMWQEHGGEGAPRGWDGSGAAEGGHAEAWQQPQTGGGGYPAAVDPLAGYAPYHSHAAAPGYNEAEQQYYNFDYHNYQAAATASDQQHMDVDNGCMPHANVPGRQQHDLQQQQQQPQQQPHQHGPMVQELLDPVHPELPGITTVTPAIGSGDYSASAAPGAAAAAASGNTQHSLSAPGSAPHPATAAAAGSGAAMTSVQGSTPAGTSSSNLFMPPAMSPARTASFHASAGSLLLPQVPVPRASMPGLSSSGSGGPPGSAALTLPTPAAAGDVSMLTVVRPSSPYARPVSPLQRTSTGMSDVSGSGGSSSQPRGFALPSPPASTAAFVKPGSSTFMPSGTSSGQQLLHQRPSTTGSTPWVPSGGGGGGGASGDVAAGIADQQQQQPWQPSSASGAAALMPNGFFTPQAAGSCGAGPWMPGQQLQQHDQSSSSKDKRLGGKPASGFVPASAGQQEWAGSRLHSHPYDQFVTRELSNINWKARHFKQPGKLNKLVPWEELEMKQEQEKEQQSQQRQQQGQGSPGSRKDAFWYRQMEHRQKLPRVMKQSASEPVAMPSHIAATHAAAAAAQQGIVSPGPAHTAQPALSTISLQADWQVHHDHHHQQQQQHYWQHAGADGSYAASAGSSAFTTPVKEMPAAADASVGGVLGSGAGSSSVEEPTPTSRYVPIAEEGAEGPESADVVQRLDYSSADVQGQEYGQHAQQGAYSGYYGTGHYHQQQYWQPGADGAWQQHGEAQQWQQVTQDPQQQCHTADTGLHVLGAQPSYAQDEQQQYFEQHAAVVPGQETATEIEQHAQQQPGAAAEADGASSLLPAGAGASAECPSLPQDPLPGLDAEAAAAADAAAGGWDVGGDAFEELGLQLDGATHQAMSEAAAVVVQQHEQVNEPDTYAADGLADVPAGGVAAEPVAQPDAAKAAAAGAQRMVGQALDSILQQHSADSVDGLVGVTSAASPVEEPVAALECEQLGLLDMEQIESNEEPAVAAADGDAPDTSCTSAAYPKDWLRLRAQLAKAAAHYEGDMAAYRDAFLQYGDYILQNVAGIDGGADGEGVAAGESAAAGSSGTAEAELQEALELWGESQLKNDVSEGCFASMNMEIGLVLSELALL